MCICLSGSQLFKERISVTVLVTLKHLSWGWGAAVSLDHKLKHRCAHSPGSDCTTSLAHPASMVCPLESTGQKYCRDLHNAQGGLFIAVVEMGSWQQISCGTSRLPCLTSFGHSTWLLPWGPGSLPTAQALFSPLKSILKHLPSFTGGTAHVISVRPRDARVKKKSWTCALCKFSKLGCKAASGRAGGNGNWRKKNKIKKK